MADLLWWLHARPWELLWWASTVTGFSWFVSEMLDTFQGWNVKLARGLTVIRAELALEKQRRIAFYKRYSKRHL